MKQEKLLLKTVEECDSIFAKLTETEWSAKPNENKWSKKEILGHLIDSASNNLRRFIVSQYQQNDKIFYLQDDWVKLQNYHGTDVSELITIWKGLNRQIARTISIIPEEKLKNTCDTGKKSTELHTLEFLIDDYLVHLKHHIEQIKK
jgi:DinB superfamily